MTHPSRHTRAALQALLVTLLWSTSWVLIKIGLRGIPALTFAGLRYFLAFLCLLPFALGPAQRAALASLTRRQWARLAVLGLVYYAIVQGAQFVGLAYLPAATVSLILNFTTVLVALLGMLWLGERAGMVGWLGILLAAMGGFVFFYPTALPASQVFGVLVMGIGTLANACSVVLGRSVNRDEDIPVLLVTVISMGVGGAVLLFLGGAIQGIPKLSVTHWLIIAWLAVVNTAFAFTLWNHTLRTLPAMESSIINSTMLVQIALLAWLFLGESLTPQKWLGMLLVAVGTLVVQLRPRQ